MNIETSPDYRKALKEISKKKYSGVYGTVTQEIKNFFKEYSSFESIWHKTFMLFENDIVRVNKIRLENEMQNSGKSGGYRIIVLCDRRTQTVGLLYIYPKVGPLGQLDIPKDKSKDLVRNYKKAKLDKAVESLEF